MELTESLVSINRRLKSYFSSDIVTGKAMWRVVFSDDQFEHRFGTYEDFTEAGIYLRTVTETRYTTKYSWIKGKYILEHLVAIPEVNLVDLPKEKVSYEVIWVFEDKYDNPLPPKWEACQFIINTVHTAMGNKGNNLRKYVDPEDTQENAIEYRNQRINQIVEELFGDQSSLQGTTKTGETIIVPRSYEKRI